MLGSFKSWHLAIAALAACLWCCAATAGPETLFEAIQAGDANRVKELLADGADVEATDEMETTPLQMAAREGHPKIIELLLDADADPNAEADGMDMTALAWAVQNKDPDSMLLLLDAGADPNVRTWMDEPLLHAAVTPG